MEKVALNCPGDACRQKEAHQPAEQCEKPQAIHKPGYELRWAVLLGPRVDFKQSRAKKIILPHSVAQGQGTLALPSGDDATSPGTEEMLYGETVSFMAFFFTYISSAMPAEHLSSEKEKIPASYPHWSRTRKTEKAIIRSVFFFFNEKYVLVYQNIAALK